MLKIFAAIGSRYELAASAPEPALSGTEPKRSVDWEGFGPHPSLQRPADEALIAELLPFHNPEYC